MLVAIFFPMETFKVKCQLDNVGNTNLNNFGESLSALVLQPNHGSLLFDGLFTLWKIND